MNNKARANSRQRGLRAPDNETKNAVCSLLLRQGSETLPAKNLTAVVKIQFVQNVRRQKRKNRFERKNWV